MSTTIDPAVPLLEAADTPYKAGDFVYVVGGRTLHTGLRGKIVTIAWGDGPRRYLVNFTPENTLRDWVSCSFWEDELSRDDPRRKPAEE